MKSIRNHVFLVLIAAGLLPVIVIFFLMKKKTSDAVVMCQYEKLEAVAEEVARQVATTMERSSSDLLSLRSNPLIVGNDTPMAERVEEMRRLVKAYRRFSDITLYGPDGFMIESTTKVHHPEPEEYTKWFNEAREKEKVVTSVPHRVNGQKGLHIKVYIPVRITGIFGVCVMKARLTFDDIWARTDGVNLGKSGEVILVDSYGKVLSCEDKSRILNSFDDGLPSGFFMSSRSGEYIDTEGNDYIYTSVVIPKEHTTVEGAWTLLALHPMSEVTAAIRESNRFLYFSGGITLLISVVLGGRLIRNISTPVGAVAGAANEVVKGNLNVKIPSTGFKELELMAESFNSMINEVRTHRYHLEQLVDSRTRRLRKSQRELEDLSAQLKATYESTQEGVLVMKTDGTILTANQQLTDIFKFDKDPEEMLYTNFGDKLCACFKEEKKFREMWEAAAEDGHQPVENAEWELVRPKEGTLNVYAAPVRNTKGEVFARLWMFNDITERKQLQVGLQRAQKMEAIGRLAGGVAHDFNNLLTGIIGNLQLVELEPGKAKGEMEASEDGARCITAAKKAGQRAAELVKQLLGFSRQSHLTLSSADANEVITDVNDLLRASIDPKISVQMNLSGDLWSVRIDSTQMEQVVMNMCVNSIDAIKDTGQRGTITLKTVNRTVTEVDIDHTKGEKPGDYVVISVSDDGAGMPAEVIEKIFEPFYTTKEQGKGTGLGLATSFGIVEQHGGWIHCSSEIGQGTTFEIYLPKQEGGKTAAASGSKEKPVVGGDETILLVDDEDVVRAVAEGMLKHYGYRILHAKDGLKAMEMLKSHPEVNLVLLDMTMPNLTGDETFARIRQEIGDLPVVVCSGYVVDLDDFGSLAGCRPQGFIQKPYAVRDLTVQVRDVMDRHKESAVANG